MNLWMGAPGGISPPNKFDDHRDLDMGNLIISICQVISRDHVIKGS